MSDNEVINGEVQEPQTEPQPENTGEESGKEE